MKFNQFFIMAALTSHTCLGYTSVYKHVDEHGNVTYTNIRSSDAKKVDLPSLVVVPAIDSDDAAARIKKRQETIKNKAQRKALEERINEESTRLEDLKAEYKDGTPDRLGSERNYQRYLDRVERLNNEINIREGNLNTLEKELQNLPNLGR